MSAGRCAAFVVSERQRIIYVYFFQIDKDVLNIMQKPQNRPPFKYSDDVVNLLRLIRNLDEHPDSRYVVTSLPLPQLYCREHLGICKC